MSGVDVRSPGVRGYVRMTCLFYDRVCIQDERKEKRKEKGKCWEFSVLNTRSS